jgi:hypothetical protein
MCSQCMGRHKVVACVLLRGRRGSDNQRGGHNNVTHVHTVTIGIEHNQLTMNRQSMAGHSIAACAEGGGRRGKRTKDSFKKHTQRENH